jgi:hypothetical protein
VYEAATSSTRPYALSSCTVKPSLGVMGFGRFREPSYNRDTPPGVRPATPTPYAVGGVGEAAGRVLKPKLTGGAAGARHRPEPLRATRSHSEPLRATLAGERATPAEVPSGAYHKGPTMDRPYTIYVLGAKA